jgi:hypothetical protein
MTDLPYVTAANGENHRSFEWYGAHAPDTSVTVAWALALNALARL